MNAPQQWVWNGLDAHRTTLAGTLSAPSLRLARAELQRQGITPTKLRRQRTPLLTRTASGKDMAVFTRQLATMLGAGIPLVQALSMIASASRRPRMTTTITALAGDIAQGTPMHEALARHPALFDPLYRQLVRVGEGTGTLDTVLERIASERERREQLKGRIIKALAYPAVVMAMALLVCMVMLLYVVPQFEHTFHGMGAELPAFTQAIITLSRWLSVWWWALVIALVLAGFAFTRIWRRSPPLRARGERILLRLPLLGALLKKAAVTRFARTLATTLQAGLPLVDALTLIAGATGNHVFSAASQRMVQTISVGGALEQAMQDSGLFPPLAVQMVAIGEEAGALDTMLHKLAGFCEDELGTAIDALSSLLEPAIMLLIGVLVGGLVIGMYLPVFNLAPSL